MVAFSRSLMCQVAGKWTVDIKYTYSFLILSIPSVRGQQYSIYLG
jgi:hypothetical protein